MPQLPPLNALRSFEAVARHMSFQAAARELSVTPAAVSYQVRQLEDHLGSALFVRMNRAIAFTPAGELLYPGLADGFARLEQAVRALGQVRDENALVISVGPAFTAKWLAPRLWRFLEDNPAIDVRISANLRSSNFQTEDLDAAIRFGRGDYSDVHSEHLITDHLIPLCSPEYRARMEIRSARDLMRCTLIHDASMEIFKSKGGFPDDWPDWRTWFKRQGLACADASHGPRFNHADHGIDAAVEGAGVVLGRRVLGGPDLRSGRLVVPVGPALPLHLAFHFVCPRDRLERPAVRAFRDWLMVEMRAYETELDKLANTAEAFSAGPIQAD